MNKKFTFLLVLMLVICANMVSFADSGLESKAKAIIKSQGHSTTTSFMVVAAKQPIKGSRIVLDQNSEDMVGHTFVAIYDGRTQSFKYYGFYPKSAVNAGGTTPKDIVKNITTDVVGVVTDDRYHGWDIAMVESISNVSVDRIKTYASTYKNYNLVKYNCSTFAWNVANIGGGPYGTICNKMRSHSWTLPHNIKDQIPGWATIPTAIRLFGYTPADTGEDFRSAAFGIIKN